MLFTPPAASFEFLFKMRDGFATLIAGAVPEDPSPHKCCDFDDDDY